MAVAGVFAVASVGHDQQLARRAADGPDGALHDPVLVIGAARHLILRFRQAKQDDAADAQGLHFVALLYQFVNRHLVILRHGADLAFHSLARTNEQRENELRRIEVRFAHQVAHGFAGPQTAEAMGRKRHTPDCNSRYVLALLRRPTRKMPEPSTLLRGA